MGQSWENGGRTKSGSKVRSRISENGLQIPGHTLTETGLWAVPSFLCCGREKVSKRCGASAAADHCASISGYGCRARD